LLAFGTQPALDLQRPQAAQRQAEHARHAEQQLAFFAGELVAEPPDDEVTRSIVVEMRSNGVQQAETGDNDDSGARDRLDKRIGGRRVATDTDTAQDLSVANQCAELGTECLDRAFNRDADGVVLSLLGRDCVEVFGQLVN
jgi:hypothetical protein